jgi:hypothetical protein
MHMKVSSWPQLVPIRLLFWVRGILFVCISVACYCVFECCCMKGNVWYIYATNCIDGNCIKATVSFSMEILVHEVSGDRGRAIAQSVSRWLSTSAARVRSQVRSSGICGGQSGTGAGFLRVLRFPLPILIHRLLHNHHHLSSGAGTIGQQWPTYQVDSVSPHQEKLKKQKQKKTSGDRR